MKLEMVRNVTRQLLEDMLRGQIVDPTDKNHGAWISPANQLPDPGHGGTLLLSCHCILMARDASLSAAERDRYCQSALAALAYFSGARRESGLIDLIQCNPDSSPDTAFALQLLAGTLLLEEKKPSGFSGIAEWKTRTSEIIEQSIVPVARGGFHTPNHRWVIVSTLALAAHLLPHLASDLESFIKAYLDEGIDIDPDGFYLERSIGIYDGVTNRSLLFIYLCGRGEGILQAVCKNLETDTFLLNGDLTAETSLSTRQDFGKKIIPLSLVDCLIGAGTLAKNFQFLNLADRLWESGGRAGTVESIFWIAWALEYHQPDFLSAKEFGLSTRFWKPFPIHRAARYRYDKTTATLTTTPVFLTLRHGGVEIAAVRFFQAIHGVGSFVPDRVELKENEVEFFSSGYKNRRPGYDQPLGQPVPWDRWNEALARRSSRRLPPLDVKICVKFDANKTHLSVKTDAGQLSGILTQLMFDVPAETFFETKDSILPLASGQEVFLESGFALLRAGGHALRLAPGNRAHRAWKLRDSAPLVNGCARIVIPYVTPIDAEITVEGMT